MYNYNRSNLKNSWHACTLVCMLCSNVYYYVLLRDTPLLRVMNHYKCKSHTVNIAVLVIYSLLLPMTYSSMLSIQ